MPELPEVETLRRELVSVIKGKIFVKAQIKVAKLIKPFSPANFQHKLKNKKILGIDRRAKVLIFELSGGLFLLIHLKMSGQLIFAFKNPKAISHKLIVGGHPQPGGLDDLPNKFTHIIFYFSDGSKLYFNDLRKFGWAKLLDKAGLKELTDEFGVEPLDKKFTLKKFQEIIKKYPNRKIKQILMDQKLIAGIGNIYADESCFCSKILPIRTAEKINKAEIEKLFLCIKKILKLAILKKGTSANTYIQLDGSKGGMQPYLNVYGRKGEKCKRCDGIISKIKLNSRGTHFCAKCQK